MRPLSETELELVRLQSNLPALRAALKRAQTKYVVAGHGQRGQRLATLKAANLAVLKAEARIAALVSQPG